jgi:hypothetical protein
VSKKKAGLVGLLTRSEVEKNRELSIYFYEGNAVCFLAEPGIGGVSAFIGDW